MCPPPRTVPNALDVIMQSARVCESAIGPIYGSLTKFTFPPGTFCHLWPLHLSGRCRRDPGSRWRGHSKTGWQAQWLALLVGTDTWIKSRGLRTAHVQNLALWRQHSRHSSVMTFLLPSPSPIPFYQHCPRHPVLPSLPPSVPPTYPRNAPRPPLPVCPLLPYPASDYPADPR